MPSIVQSDVELLGHTPALVRPGDYAQYHLTKRDLGALLADWPRAVRWTPRIRYDPEPAAGFHPTARRRLAVPAPISDYLRRVGHGSPASRVLYHGVGRDEPGAVALSSRGTVTRFDPCHPDPAIRQHPRGHYSEIHSHYTLNIVDPYLIS